MKRAFLLLGIVLLMTGCARPQSPGCNLYIHTERDFAISATAAKEESRAVKLERAAATQARFVSLLSGAITTSFKERQKSKSPSDRNDCDILTLSAGGQYEAYGSGFPARWEKEREIIPRSDIDMITGVSTGAIMATFAFLGSSTDPAVRKKYDDFSRITISLIWPCGTLLLQKTRCLRIRLTTYIPLQRGRGV